jgi:predicted metal-dependent hydrolase
MSLPDLYDLKEVSEALGMSERWLRERCKEGAAHTRLGRKIRFTEEQYRALVDENATSPKVARSVTTGRGRRSA